MTRMRYASKPSGTCLAVDCEGSGSVTADGKWANGFCAKHSAARAIEVREREARGEGPQVFRLADYERDEHGRVQRK